MKVSSILFLALLLNLTGCVTIVKWKYGIKKPGEETPAKLLSFLEKHKYADTCQFLFNDSASYFKCFRNTRFRKNLFGHLVFDRDGTLLQRDTTKCQWSGYEVIRALNPDSLMIQVQGLQLDEITDNLCSSGIAPRQRVGQQQPDFTVVITWAKFLGTYNERLFELCEAVSQNRTARIRLILLNVDMQKSWNLTKDQKMTIQ